MCCPWCGRVDWLSTKHFTTSCAALDAKRARLGALWGVPAAWWVEQSRVTSKSGWFTWAAGRDTTERAKRQIAMCSLGITLMKRFKVLSDGGWFPSDAAARHGNPRFKVNRQ